MVWLTLCLVLVAGLAMFQFLRRLVRRRLDEMVAKASHAELAEALPEWLREWDAPIEVIRHLEDVDTVRERLTVLDEMLMENSWDAPNAEASRRQRRAVQWLRDRYAQANILMQSDKRKAKGHRRLNP